MQQKHIPFKSDIMHGFRVIDLDGDVVQELTAMLPDFVESQIFEVLSSAEIYNLNVSVQRFIIDSNGISSDVDKFDSIKPTDVSNINYEIELHEGDKIIRSLGNIEMIVKEIYIGRFFQTMIKFESNKNTICLPANFLKTSPNNFTIIRKD